MSESTLHGMRERWLDWNRTDMTPLTCAADLQSIADQLQAVVERMACECSAHHGYECDRHQLQRILGTAGGGGK